MSNTKYTDPTNASDPPGGKVHIIGEAVPAVVRRSPKKRAAKSASARKTVKATGARKTSKTPSIKTGRPVARSKKSAVKAKR
jgi:hypothetical protein